MAAQTQDSSGSSQESETPSTPMSSYFGLAIIAAIVVFMIVLQTFSTGTL